MNKSMKMTKEISVIIGMLLLVGFVGIVGGAECTSQECAGEISLTVGNSNPTIPVVAEVSQVVLTGASTKTVYVVFNASDDNGYADLDHGTASVTLNKSGEIDRVSTSCVGQENWTKISEFNCTVTMQFYDVDGADWEIHATVDDTSAVSAWNVSETFTVAPLDYVSSDEITTVTWAAATVETNDVEAGNTITLTNGGNQDYTSLDITGYDATLNDDTIYAANFSVDAEASQTEGQVYMVNDTVTDVSGVIAGLTDHGAAITEEIFFYVDVPAAIATGEYAQVKSWVIKVAAS